MPSGTFNHALERAVGGLGHSPTSTSEYPKGYSDDLLAAADSPQVLITPCNLVFRTPLCYTHTAGSSAEEARALYRIFLVEDDRGIADAIATQTALWDMETVCARDFRNVMA